MVTAFQIRPHPSSLPDQGHRGQLLGYKSVTGGGLEKVLNSGNIPVRRQYRKNVSEYGRPSMKGGLVRLDA